MEHHPPTFSRNAGLMNEFGKGRTATNATNVGPQKKDPKTKMSWKKASKKDATEAGPNVGRSDDMETDDVVNPVNVGVNAKEAKVKAVGKKESKEEGPGIWKLIIFKNDSEQVEFLVDCLEIN